MDVNRMYRSHLMCMDSIKIDSFGTSSKQSGQIYGQVSLCDIDRDQDIFLRERSNPETVKLGGEIKLSYPEHATPATAFQIYVDLYDAEDDRVIADGSIFWEGRYCFNYPFDTTIIKRVEGDDGCSALVQFIALEDCMEAKFEARFNINHCLRHDLREESLPGSKFHPNCERFLVYGSIKVEQIYEWTPNRPSKIISLFERSENEAVDVLAKEAIPLLVSFAVAQKPKKGPPLKILLKLQGRAISMDKSEIPFTVEKEIPCYLSFEAKYLKPIIFNIPVKFESNKKKMKNTKFQVMVTVH